MTALLLAVLMSDPQMTQVTFEGRSQDTLIDIRFHGRPTFQSFRSYSPNVLVVDVVGASLPAGFPAAAEVMKDVRLELSEHVGRRTRLLRIRLTLPPRLEPQLLAAAQGIHVILPRSSAVAKAFGPAGARPAVQQALASRLQKKLHSLQGVHSKVSEQLTAKEEEIERLARRLSDALAKVNRLDRNLVAKDRSVADAERARRQAEGKAAHALLAVEATQAQVRGEVTALERKQAGALLEQVKGAAELEARRSEIDRLLRQQETLKTQLSALRRTTGKQGRERERLVQTEVGLRADVETNLRELSKESAELRQLNKRVKSGEQALVSLASDRKKNQKSLRKVTKNIVGRRVDLTRIEGLGEKLDSSLKTLQASISSRQVKADKLQASYAKARSALKHKQQEQKRSLTQRKALDKSLLLAAKRSASTEKRINKTEAENGRLRSQAKATQASIKSASAEEIELRARARELSQKSSVLRGVLATLKTKLKPLTQRKSVLASAIDGEQQRVAHLDAEVAKATAALAQAGKGLKKYKALLARLQRQRKAQQSLATALNKKTEQTRIARAKVSVKSELRKVVVAEPVLVAEAKPRGARKVLSDAQPRAGFGGGPPVQRGRFERIGYRPIGPERVLVRFGGNSEPKLRRVSKGRSVLTLPGVSATGKRLRALDTSLFGGMVLSILPGQTRQGLKVELRHEEGVTFDLLRTVSGVELRLR
ncbi:MAG: hypothetical protein OSB21_08640 [Myxococcota bacterium]|nr:hypothetical protein [Myxococcota bacterium]